MRRVPEAFSTQQSYQLRHQLHTAVDGAVGAVPGTPGWHGCLIQGCYSHDCCFNVVMLAGNLLLSPLFDDQLFTSLRILTVTSAT